MVSKQHQVRKTLLIVGEGDSEEAFLKHLRDLYCSGGAGLTVTVRNAHGKGPENVIDHAAKQAKHSKRLSGGTRDPPNAKIPPVE